MNLHAISLALMLLAAPLPSSAAEKTQVHVSGQTVTSKALAAELKAYVEADMLAKGGWFIIFDEVEKALVRLKPLKLDDGAHIHRLGHTSFLSWGEFKSDKGSHYMLDFYFDLKGSRLLMAAPLTIYLKDKETRYGWDEDGEYMKKLEAGIKP